MLIAIMCCFTHVPIQLAAFSLTLLRSFAPLPFSREKLSYAALSVRGGRGLDGIVHLNVCMPNSFWKPRIDEEPK